MNSFIFKDESGMATPLALMVLTLLTLIGASITETSNIELQSATNDNLHKMAFFSAEAARSYVELNPNIYGADNIDPALPNFFPNNSDPYVPITAGPVAPFNLGNSSSFTGTVIYDRRATPPRGSGYSASRFKAHVYGMVCLGNSPRNTVSRVDAGFYRIGY